MGNDVVNPRKFLAFPKPEKPGLVPIFNIIEIGRFL